MKYCQKINILIQAKIRALSIIYILLLSILFLGCSKPNLAFLNEDLFGKSVNRVMIRIGFIHEMIRDTNASVDTAEVKFYADIVISELSVLKKRARHLDKKNSVFKNLSTIEERVRNMESLYRHYCRHACTNSALGNEKKSTNGGAAHKAQIDFYYRHYLGKYRIEIDASHENILKAYKKFLPET